jgi:transcriptional regulator with XRE-family HTH domain
MSLGTFLRDWRKHADRQWTQREIAQRANDYLDTDVIDQGRVSYWERDQAKTVSADHLRLLAAVYRVPMVELLVAAGLLERRDLVAAPTQDAANVEAFRTLAVLIDRAREELARLERRSGNGNGGGQPPSLTGGQD